MGTVIITILFQIGKQESWKKGTGLEDAQQRLMRICVHMSDMEDFLSCYLQPAIPITIQVRGRTEEGKCLDEFGPLIAQGRAVVAHQNI